MDDKKQTPYELFGIECGNGWHSLLTPIFEYIEEYNKDKEEDNKIKITQIKEKFGVLRIYCNHYTDDLRKIIYDAVENSKNTCENCGTHENLGWTKPWYKRLCKDCSTKYSHLEWKQDN